MNTNYQNPNNHWRTANGGSQDKDPSLKAIVMTMLFCIAMMFLMWLFSGCTTTRNVPVTETRTEHHWHTDSVRQRDSTHTERETIIREVDSAAMARYGIQMERNQRAWLVLQRELEQRLHELEHMAASKDTVRDSIPVPYPVTEYVERKPSVVERLLMIVGALSLLVLIVFAAIKARRFLP